MTEDTSPTTGRLYVWITGWEKFQGRRDRPNLAWFRVYSDLASNDDWNELSTTDRCLLIGLWMDTNRLGNGRVSANQKSLRSRHSAHKSSLESLVQAGFITLSTTKGAPTGHQNGVLEEKRGEEKPLKVSPSPIARSNGKPATPNGAGSPTKVKKLHRPLEPGQHRDAEGFLY